MRSTTGRTRGGALSAVLGLALATGCNVGPKYRRPPVVTPSAFKEAHPANPPGTWVPARPADTSLKGKWWRIFGEPELDGLEGQLDIDNQTIAQSFQNFMAARAQVGVARSAYFPTVSAGPSYTHTWTGGGSGSARATGTGVAPTGTLSTGGITGFDFFSLPADVSWAPDLWDRVRNSVRQAQYAAQVSAADLENQRLVEQATLAQFYFQLRGQDALIAVYERTIRADRAALEFTRAQEQTGVGTPLARAQAEVTLANAEAVGAGLLVNRAIFEHAIATLIGKPASSFALPVHALSTPVPTIPVAVPSQLLERRPDIAAAERTLAEANALIGVAKAAYYPTFNLTATGGFASTALSTLFSVPSLFWSLGASASETIFDGGLRRATVAQDEAFYRADVAAYRQIVLTAFQQVEDGLATLRVLSEQVARQEVAVNAARTNLDMAQATYETGVQSYLNVINAQTLLLSDEETLVTLHVNQMTAAVQLVQALGGGWNVARLPTPSEVTSDKGIRKASGS